MSRSGTASELVTLAGVKIEVERRGKGKPLLLLMGEEMLETEGELVEQLERSHEIIIPYPPGFGDSERPLWITRPDDIAFLWLDLVERMQLDDATVVGFSLGGWIAAEMATMDDSWIGRLALVAPYGIKLGGPTDRDIADIWLLNPNKVTALKWHDPDKGKRDFASMPDEKLTRIAQAIETTARLCWEPYMHNPKLKHRLHRIKVPTLVVWGANDGIVKADSYGAGFAQLIPGAKLQVISEAGHLPHLEQPAAFKKAIDGFVG